MSISRRRCQSNPGYRGWRKPKASMVFLMALSLTIGFALTQPANAADCPDGDGDGFVVCNGCVLPSGKSCGECDDGNASINPGATEICNGIDDDCDGDVDLADSEFNYPDSLDDFVDNDGDGEVDEGFGTCIFFVDGPCETAGRLTCPSSPGTNTVTNQYGTLTCEGEMDYVLHFSPEGGPDDPSCSNARDDDCDGFTDLEDPQCWKPELCDGLDNDGNDGVDENWPDLGEPCTAGVGECATSGFMTCLPDGSGAACSAKALKPKKEGSLWGATCEGGKDEDCDGDVDLADLDCAGYGDPELCGDGADNDGDGKIDEGFPTIGLECAEGVGGCKDIGQFVCSANGTGTECDAEPGAPVEESEGAGTCGDFVDNDCDGFIDADDDDCASAYADLGVNCSLPYVLARPGKDCTGKHIIEFSGGQATNLTAELLALDADGSLLDIIENVQAGDIAHLASRLDPDDFNVSTKSNKTGTRHTVYAPMPLLRVTGTKNGIQDTAYCSIMPYLEVTSPQGQTISLSEGKDLEVGAFLPLVDVDTLGIWLNGVDVLSELDFASSDFPTNGPGLCGSPGECVFKIEAGCGDGSQVDVEILNLKVEGLDKAMASDAKDGVEHPDQVNTVSFTVTGLPPGGHIFYFSGDPLPLPKTLSSECLFDDLADAGTASSFGITIASPMNKEIVYTAPVHVRGTACGGNEIASLKINGKPVDVTIPANQTCTAGDGMFTAEQCVVNFDEPMEKRAMSEAIAGTAHQGTYLRGSNRIIADAIDVDENRTFNTETVFALGPVRKPAAMAALQLNSGADAMAKRILNILQADANIDTAFVAGLEEQGAQDFFNQLCTGALEQFFTAVSQTFTNKTIGTFDIEPDCSCDIYDIPVRIYEITPTYYPETLPDDPTCAVDFRTDEIGVTIHLPDIKLAGGADRWCEIQDYFETCHFRTVVDTDVEINVTDILFEYTITEAEIETGTPSKDSISFSYDIKDSDGNPQLSALGTCVGGPDDGETCRGDNQCEPDSGAGTCAGGTNDEATCSVNEDCPVNDDGFGKCIGGENQGRMCESNIDCPDGDCYATCAGTCDGVVKNDSFDVITHQGSGIECWLAKICNFFDLIGRAIAGAFAYIFTWGDFEFGPFFAEIIGVGGIEFEKDLLSELNLTQPDAMGLGEMGLDPDKLSQADNASFTPGAIDVEIEDGGLTVAFGAEFTSQCPDTGETEGPSLTPATAPTVGQVIPVADEVSLMIADDVINQIFSSMTTCGQLQAFCSTDDNIKTVGDLLPANCEDLPTPKAQGICHAIRGDDCSAIVGLPREKGICHGFAGTDCTSLPNNQQDDCEQTDARNIDASDNLLVCGGVDMDPEFSLLKESPADTVGAHLLLKQVSFVFVLDRSNDNYTGELSDLNGCDSNEGNAAPDCRMVAACLDLTIDAHLGLDDSACSENEVGFAFSSVTITPSINEAGVVCSPSSTGTPDTSTLQQALESRLTDAVANKAEAFAPAFCVEGLTLNGVLDFDSANAKLFGIATTEFEPGYADYLGITVGLDNLP